MQDYKKKELLGTIIELEIQNEEKEKRAAELLVLNKELARAEEKLCKANRLYSFISRINQIILQVKDEKELFSNICHMALELGKFKMVWIGMIDEKTKNVIPVMYAGKEENYLSKIKTITIKDVSEGKGPTGRSLREGKYAVCNDIQNDPLMAPWKTEALNHGYRSSIALPIKKSEKIIGAFTLYASEINFFDKQQIFLLEEATGDISFALELFEKEKQKKEALENLKRSEERFKVIFEDAPIGIAVIDSVTGKIQTVNLMFAKIAGRSAEELANIDWMSITHPDDIQLDLNNMALLIDGKINDFQMEKRYIHPDGTIVWINMTISRILLDSKSNLQHICMIEDITKRKLSEAKLNKLALQLNEVSSSIPGAVYQFILKPDGSFSFPLLSKGMVELSGLSLEEIYADANVAFAKIHPDDLSEVMQSIQYSAANLTSWLQIFRFIQPNSTLKWIRGNSIPGKLADGSVLWNGTMIDVSDLKEAQEKLVQNNLELQKTNAELDRFIYSVSHDLRSPLTSVLGLLSILEKESKEVHTLQYAQMIRTSINRQDEFIKNILSYSKNNRTELQIEKINLQKTLEEIIDSLHNIKGAENINIEVDVKEIKPFYSDKQRFNTIMENLISNALKYHKNDVPGRFIKVTGNSDNHNLYLTIEDNGVGISPEYHSKIFDMFFRLPGKAAGSGIGLYIVKETINNLQGKIKIISEEGVGTAFNIVLKNFKP